MSIYIKDDRCIQEIEHWLRTFFYILSFSDRLSITLHKIHYESHTRENIPPILQLEFSTNVPCYCVTLEKSIVYIAYTVYEMYPSKK